MRLQQLDPRRFDDLRTVALALSRHTARREAYVAVADLIACTDAAHREADGEPLPEVSVDAAADHGKPRYAPALTSEPQPTADALEAAGIPMLPRWALPPVRAPHGPSRRPPEIGDAVGRVPELVIADDVTELLPERQLAA